LTRSLFSLLLLPWPGLLWSLVGNLPVGPQLSTR